jgi:4-amino-4-deoxy-L-arabinose transferase-like glycosyltransferase
LSLGFKIVPLLRTDWAYFLIFALSNAVLSSPEPPVFLKILVFFLGIVAPLAAFFFIPSLKAGAKEEIGVSEIFPPLPSWVLLLVLSAAVFLRFYKLNSLFIWPNQDAGWIGLYAIQLGEKWDWKFFQTFGQEPPLTVWAMVGLLKLGVNPLTAVSLLPALLSLMTVVMGYLACRQYFSSSFSLITGSLLALSYWPLLMGRICQQGIWLPFWVCLCLFLFGKMRACDDEGRKVRWAVALGVGGGLGSFTFTPWPVPALVLVALVFRQKETKSFHAKRHQWFFLGAFLLTLIPFAVAAVRENFGTHLWAMSATSGWFPFHHWCMTVLSYISALFWGTLQADTIYSALQGGLLNPFLGALFFLGLSAMIRFRRFSGTGWILASLFLFLLPGILSMNVQMLRVAQVLPLVVGITALGLQRLLLGFSRPLRFWMFLGLMTASLGFDVSRFMKAMPNPETSGPQVFQMGIAVQDWRAFQVLKQVEAQWGPGWVFTEFTSSWSDQTPFIAAYPFNAAENPNLPPSPVRWAAVFTDIHYQPFLAPRFPNAQWYALDRDLPGAPGLLMGVLPVNEKTIATLQRWRDAHRYFRQLSFDMLDISEPRTYSAASDLFQRRPPALGLDPFLEACYWEKLSDFYYNFDFRDHYEDQVHALGQAIERGYTASHLYYRLSSLLIRKRRFTEAKTLLQTALRLYPRDEDIQTVWSLLQEQEKGNGKK